MTLTRREIDFILERIKTIDGRVAAIEETLPAEPDFEPGLRLSVAGTVWTMYGLQYQDEWYVEFHELDTPEATLHTANYDRLEDAFHEAVTEALARTPAPVPA